MLKLTLLAVALCVGAAQCAPEAGAAAPSEPAPANTMPKKLGSLATGMFDVGLISAKNLGRLGVEAMPHLDQFGRAVGREAGELTKRVQSNERVKGLWSSFQNGVDQYNKKIWADHEARRAKLLQPKP